MLTVSTYRGCLAVKGCWRFRRVETMFCFLELIVLRFEGWGSQALGLVKLWF